jgi:hypothetical protein
MVGRSMSYNRNNKYRRSTSGAGSRWMNLRYSGNCKVCGAHIAAGDLAYWDAGARAVTCKRIDCADADGLTTNRPLTGPWDTRTDTRELADHRIGSAAPRVIATTFNSGASVYVNARGHCEDAPACGCCS